MRVVVVDVIVISTKVVFILVTGGLAFCSQLFWITNESEPGVMGTLTY